MQYTVSEPEKLLFRSGWVGGEEENKDISAFVEVKVEVEADCITYWLSSLDAQTEGERYKLSKHSMYNIVGKEVLDNVQSLSAFSILSQGFHQLLRFRLIRIY